MILLQFKFLLYKESKVLINQKDYHLQLSIRRPYKQLKCVITLDWLNKPKNENKFLLLIETFQNSPITFAGPLCLSMISLSWRTNPESDWKLKLNFITTCSDFCLKKHRFGQEQFEQPNYLPIFKLLPLCFLAKLSPATNDHFWYHIVRYFC